MDNLILLFACLLAGVALQRAKAFPADAYKAFNAFVIYVSLPAVALYYIPKIQLSSELLLPVGAAWLVFGGAALLFWSLGKAFGWSPKLVGCLILTAGLGNTSFVGFPVIEALYGKEGIQIAILFDQPGTFVVMSTLGIAMAGIYSQGKLDGRAILQKIGSFPPFWAFLLGLLLNLCRWDFPEAAQSAFQKIAVTVSPVALVSVGLQLKMNFRSAHWQFLGWGLFYKLLLAPALLFLLYVVVLGKSGPLVQVSIMESAMAPMITAAIVASSAGLKPDLANRMIGFGIPLSLLTLGLWYVLLQWV